MGLQVPFPGDRVRYGRGSAGDLGRQLLQGKSRRPCDLGAMAPSNLDFLLIRQAEPPENQGDFSVLRDKILEHEVFRTHPCLNSPSAKFVNNMTAFHSQILALSLCTLLSTSFFITDL